MDGWMNLASGGLSFIALMACSAQPDSEEEGSRNAVRGDAVIGGKSAKRFEEAVLIDIEIDGSTAARCSGALLAERVVLTAGHCVRGFSGWMVTAPYADGAAASATEAVTLDWTSAGQTVVPSQHDVGLLFLADDIVIPAYPQVASAPVPPGTHVVNVGRTREGEAEDDRLFAGPPVPIDDGSTIGFPYDYVAEGVIEPGDSGGPTMLARSGPHTVVAVNSGGGDGIELLARVDLVRDWIDETIEAHGPPTPPPCSHDPCVTGAELPEQCHPCVSAVCDFDEYCCNSSWDDQCVAEVGTSCGAVCY